ncbi:histone-lysine N-methyltransferase SETMAR [Trichonephila clavipes]|uniref:Histone-lysine N-methyltransferase SETMAR n=1 Tax=Trichonephila clavipes TaxID=2585209 RepID=A0A8X6RRE6_TRICX|nr:histone-lysine N-methyltransferase SETMAR [Trichonephila clavipes]
MLVRLSRAPVLSGGLRRKTQLFSCTLYMAASSKTPPQQSKGLQKFKTPLPVPGFPGSSPLCHHTNSENPSDTTSFHSVLKFPPIGPEISASWKLHHDNAPSHTCFVVTEHLTKNGIVTIPQPSYSPDLAPAAFFLFPKGKTALKGRHHGTLDDVKRVCTHALKDVSVGDFQGAYEAWKRRLQKCVHAQGAYFEDY